MYIAKLFNMNIFNRDIFVRLIEIMSDRVIRSVFTILFCNWGG